MLAQLQKRVTHRVKREFYRPRIAVEPLEGLLTLGSGYGGWTFKPSHLLEGATIVSCGVGEDASFDVEFASRFGARVIMVDPTPRAIEHFASLEQRLGQPATVSYPAGGRMPATAYDLSEIAPGALVLEPMAIWTEGGTVRFYAPGDPMAVSHSIGDIQGSGKFIEVPAITPTALLAKYRLRDLPLMKMDIEGAELKVIPYMLTEGILPAQLLIEYDEIHFPSADAKRRIEAVDAALRLHGYRCRHSDGLSNFLYIRQAADAA